MTDKPTTNLDDKITLALLGQKVDHLSDAMADLVTEMRFQRDLKADQSRVDQLEKTKADKAELEVVKRSLGWVIRAIWTVGSAFALAIVGAIAKLILS